MIINRKHEYNISWSVIGIHNSGDRANNESNLLQMSVFWPISNV